MGQSLARTLRAIGDGLSRYTQAVHPALKHHSFDLNLHRLLTKKRELSRAVLAPVAMSKEDQSALLASSVQSKR